MLRNDPWDTTLVPVEPEPELFDTFVEYEKAMRRWAFVCTNYMSIVPPHPSQLSNLILLQTAVERKVCYLFLALVFVIAY